jgi:hypothetical protein
MPVTTKETTSEKEATRKAGDLGGLGSTLGKGGKKPVYVPHADETDAASHAVNDNLFWCDILMEHAAFFETLMPGDELERERAQAIEFRDSFAQQFDNVRRAKIDRDNFKKLNQQTIELAKPFIEYKHRLEEAQSSGRLRSLVWSLFFNHTAFEAERFVMRLDRLSRGEAELDRNEVIKFWTKVMDEHARFVEHLLDPDEFDLVKKARDTASTFRALREGGPVKALASEPGVVAGALSQNPNWDAVLAAAETILDFKVAAEEGIQAGKIKSIIHPTLADHVRREAAKFVDELRRSV